MLDGPLDNFYALHIMDHPLIILYTHKAGFIDFQSLRFYRLQYSHRHHKPDFPIIFPLLGAVEMLRIHGDLWPDPDPGPEAAIQKFGCRSDPGLTTGKSFFDLFCGNHSKKLNHQPRFDIFLQYIRQLSH
jgi:hypothetical protein